MVDATFVKWTNRFYWFAAFLFLAYFLIIAAPKKGFDLSDHGIYATSANNFLFGIFNEYGLTGLVNAVLIKMGFGYLNMTRFFYFLEFISGLLFVVSLRLRTPIYWVAPIAVALMLVSSPTHLLSYENAGPVFLMMATSFLFFAINDSIAPLKTPLKKNICYALSAIFYVYSSTTNTILFPSLLVNAVILFFFYPRVRNGTFITTYLASAGVALYLIFFKILPVFELTPFYHPGFLLESILRIFKNSLALLGLVFFGFVSAKVVFLINRIVWDKFNTDYVKTIALIMSTGLLWIGIRIYFPNYTFASWENCLFIYGLIYLGVILASYGWRFYQSRTLSLLMFALVLHIEYYLASLVDGLPWSIRTLGNGSQVCLIVLLCLEYYFIHDNNKFKKTLVTTFLFIGSLYAFNMQLLFAYGNNPLLNTEKIVNINRLNGLYERPDIVDNMKKIVAVYDQNNCENKLFISRQIFSLFYYIFDRVGYSPLYFLDPKDDLKRLQQARAEKLGFCFMSDTILDRYPTTKSDVPGMIVTQTLRHWLQLHAKKIIYLPVAKNCCGNSTYVKLYVG